MYTAIERWFPIVSCSSLLGNIPETWDEASLDLVVFCLSVELLATPSPAIIMNSKDPAMASSLYLHVKRQIGVAEGLGINSLLMVQARLLANLFEVAHGIYPAAYISIAAAIRAAEALDGHSESNISRAHNAEIVPDMQTRAKNWAGLRVLDR